jgi:hypothetical protein
MPRRIHACSSWLSILLSAAMLNAQSVPLPRPPAKPQLHGLFTRYEGQSSPRPAERTATTGVERARAHAPLATAAAPVSGPGLRIDPTQSRHAISPYVYGINVYGLTDSQFATLRVPVTRWGGDATSEYNWQFDKSSTASDWYFEIFAQSTTFNPPSTTSTR